MAITIAKTEEAVSSPCDRCPWQLSNQGKRHKFGFFTKANLTRLWNQIRRGGQPQSCHMTDSSHPDHVACGTKPDAKVRECPGSVILVVHELMRLNRKAADGVIGPEACDAYLAERRKGLTKDGILYWLVQRFGPLKHPLLGGTGEEPPNVDPEDTRIGLPMYLQEPEKT